MDEKKKTEKDIIIYPTITSDEIEDNSTKIYLDDTIDLTKTIKEVREEIEDE